MNLTRTAILALLALQFTLSAVLPTAIAQPAKAPDSSAAAPPTKRTYSLLSPEEARAFVEKIVSTGELPQPYRVNLSDPLSLLSPPPAWELTEFPQRNPAIAHTSARGVRIDGLHHVVYAPALVSLRFYDPIPGTYLGQPVGVFFSETDLELVNRPGALAHTKGVIKKGGYINAEYISRGWLWGRGPVYFLDKNPLPM